MSDLETAQAAHDAADRAYRDWSSETDRLAREAADAVKAARRDEAARLLGIRQDAFIAYRAAENAAVTPHEWDGKRVVFREEIRNKWSYAPTGQFKEPVYGVVEAYRHGTVMPENLPWRMRNMKPGTPFIRLLKKDGTPGLRVEGFSNKWSLDQ